VEPIKTVEQMLTYDMKFGFYDQLRVFFENVPDSVDSAILIKSVQGPDIGRFFNWAVVYQNMSIVLGNLNIEIYRDMGKVRDENKRPLLCELENGGVKGVEMVLLVYRGNPLLELINNVIDRMVEVGIVLHIKKRDFPTERNFFCARWIYVP
jgi:hypothetical protein